jgi:hypothetical protein
MAIRPCRESTEGWTAAPGDRNRRNQSFYELNEHGPALNVFWSRKSGMGAGGEVIDLAAPDRQVKANQAQNNPGSDGLDPARRNRYGEGAYKKRAGGVWPWCPPFRFKCG